MDMRTGNINETFAVEHRGCRLAYSVRGDGPPVLFIQGVGVHGDGWRPQVDELASHGVPIECSELINNMLLEHIAQTEMASIN